MQVSKINSINYSRPAFQARVSKELQNTILRESVELGTAGLNRAKAQIAKIQNWGSPNSILDSTLDTSTGKMYLGISNFSISKNYGANFEKDKGNILDTFMSLEKNDILFAEKQIQSEVENNKVALAIKALENKKLLKKITGSESPSNEDLAAAIDKLSEDDIINLRFNLDEPSKFSDGKILDFDF